MYALCVSGAVNTQGFVWTFFKCALYKFNAYECLLLVLECESLFFYTCIYALCVSGAVNTHGFVWIFFFFNAPYIYIFSFFHSLTHSHSLRHSFVHSP